MSQSHQFRVQSTAPSTPDSGVVTLYANASGSLVAKASDGSQSIVGGQLTGTLGGLSIATGGAGTVSTGVLFSAVTTAVQTGLGTPSFWAPILGPDNKMYAFPCYPYR